MVNRMAVFYKVVPTVNNPEFKGRSIGVGSFDNETINITSIPVPDEDVICNGCNGNIYPEPANQIFLSRLDVKNNHVYDVYCDKCRNEYFPKAVQIIPTCTGENLVKVNE
jgi:hypothetical protein